jgi:hypothetical protein
MFLLSNELSEMNYFFTMSQKKKGHWYDHNWIMPSAETTARTVQSYLYLFRIDTCKIDKSFKILIYKLGAQVWYHLIESSEIFTTQIAVASLHAKWGDTRIQFQLSSAD